MQHGLSNKINNKKGFFAHVGHLLFNHFWQYVLEILFES